MVFRVAISLAADHSAYNVMKRLLDTKLFDINYVTDDKKIKFWHGAITLCAISSKGYDRNRPDKSENMKVFDLLLSQDELDIDLKTHARENMIYLLQKNKTKHFTQLLKAKAKSNKYNWSKKYTFEKIEQEIKTNEIASALGDAGMRV